jgi:outer membrane receptor protein involved in Fe transport
MKKIILTLLFIIPLILLSQKGNINILNGEIYGEIIDSISNEPMEYVTIALYNKDDNKIVTGTSTNTKGKYNIGKIKEGVYYIKISFVGYQDKLISNMNISETKSVFNLKNIKLSATLNLQEVVIRGDIPTITYEIDKKVVNVEDMNTTIGQSAVEVLENTPSVQVNNDGNVTLRGSSSFTLLIDGIPTAMDANDALKTIPASTIKNIEIITNPSARQQAEGVGGIINIITKKNKLEGASLLANVSGGNFNRYGGDIALSYKVKKNSFNLGGSYNKRNHIKSSYETRTSTYDSLVSKVIKSGVNSWEHGGYRINFDWMYTPNSSHVFSVGGKVGQTLMNPFDNANYQELANNIPVINYYNEEYDDIDMRSISSFLNYRYNFNRNDKNYLSLRGVYNIRTVDEYSYTNFYDNNNNKIGGNYATEFGPSKVFRVDLDYVKPLKNKMILEAGLQTQFGISKDDKDNYQFDTTTQTNILLPLFSTDVQYNRNIHSAYSLIRGKKKKLGYQVGLRAEYTFRKIEASNISTPFQNIDRIDLFPSAHFSYKINDDQELLVGYSRRIQRPRSYYFEPFITWLSPYSVRRGNGSLKPEYISSAEINWIKRIEKKGSISVEAYGKFLTNLINHIPSIYDTNIILSSPENLGNSTSIGIEPNFIYNITDWWNSNLGGNIYYYSITSTVVSNEGSSESINWNARWRNSFSFKNNWRLQVVTNYTSKTVTALGTQEHNYGMDASLRKTFSKNKYALNFQVVDIFSTRRNIFTRNINNVVIYQNNNPFSPKFMLTFSLKLNNYEKVYNKQRELDAF